MREERRRRRRPHVTCLFRAENVRSLFRCACCFLSLLSLLSLASVRPSHLPWTLLLVPAIARPFELTACFIRTSDFYFSNASLHHLTRSLSPRLRQVKIFIHAVVRFFGADNSLAFGHQLSNLLKEKDCFHFELQVIRFGEAHSLRCMHARYLLRSIVPTPCGPSTAACCPTISTLYSNWSRCGAIAEKRNNKSLFICFDFAFRTAAAHNKIENRKQNSKKANLF